jgi:hypothetical protein
MGNKSVFWQALIVTILIFIVGLIFGYYIESSRTSTVELNLLSSEVNLLDEQLRGNIVENSNLSCEIAVDSTFAFADKVYDEALKLEQYDLSSKFNSEIMLALHRRYDLLRTMLWTEAVTLKKRCPGFHTVVYFFDYTSKDIDIKAKQSFFSNLLKDVKDGNPSKVLLIPIAADLDLASVEIAMQNYGVKSSPVILIDENKIVNDVVTLKEIEDLIFSKSNSTVKK